VRGRATVVTMDSLPELQNISPLMLGTLHHLGELDFVVTDPMMFPIQKWFLSIFKMYRSVFGSGSISWKHGYRI
jgi:hypothetical protein